MLIKKLSCLGAGIAAVAAMGTLAGCGAASNTANAATSKIEQTTITVDSVPAAEEAALYVAQAQGFFARQGLKVNIRPVTGGEAAIPDLQSGRVQLVAGNYVSFVLAQMAGEFHGRAGQPADHRARRRDDPGHRGAVRQAGLEVPDRGRAGPGPRHDRPEHRQRRRPGAARRPADGKRLHGAQHPAGHPGGRLPPGDDHAADGPARRRLAAPAAGRPGRAGVRRGARSPTSTRARCRTSRSPATSAPPSGCRATRARWPPSCARCGRATSWPTPTAPRWRRRWRST